VLSNTAYKLNQESTTISLSGVMHYNQTSW